MWCAHTTHPTVPIPRMAYTMLKEPKISSLPVKNKTLTLTTPKAGKIKI
jgi:hypothetical protein